MKDIEKHLKEILKSISGNILGIGIKDEKLIKIIDNNININNCTLLNNINTSDSDEKGYIQTINIRRLRKVFKKKKTDYIIGNMEDLEKYLKYFIKDSIFISRNKIYLYGKLDKEKFDNLVKKYERYNVEIAIRRYRQNFLLTIDSQNAKSYKLKDLGYFIYYTISDLLTIFTDILAK